MFGVAAGHAAEDAASLAVLCRFEVADPARPARAGGVDQNDPAPSPLELVGELARELAPRGVEDAAVQVRLGGDVC